MQLISTVSLLALGASLTAAAPAPIPKGPFYSLAIRSASPIMYESLEARDFKIFLGGKPATYCPIPPKQCPPGNETAFIVGSGAASMDTEVPGGQQVYVNPTTGALQYTQAHTVGPSNGIYTGFSRTRPVNGENYDFWSFQGAGATGFVACPISTYNYQVFANIHGHNWSKCLGFEALAAKYDNGSPAAWQYT